MLRSPIGWRLCNSANSVVAAASRTGAGPVVHRFVHDRTARQVVRPGLSLWPVSFPDRKRPVFCRSLADLRLCRLPAPRAAVPTARFAGPVAPKSGRIASAAAWRSGSLSFSISRVRSWTASFAACSSAVAAANSLCHAEANARSASGSEGRSAEARDIPCLHRMWPKATRTNRESATCQTSMGRGGAGGAIVRRQSIASISSANCAGVNVNVPSTIGGQTNLLRSSRLANRHRPLPSQYRPFR